MVYDFILLYLIQIYTFFKKWEWKFFATCTLNAGTSEKTRGGCIPIRNRVPQSWLAPHQHKSRAIPLLLVYNTREAVFVDHYIELLMQCYLNGSVV